MTPAEATALLERDPSAASAAIEKVVDARVDAVGEHIAWARVCERAGLSGPALREWLLAVRDDAGDPEACAGLAETYRERGEGARAIPLWEQVLEKRDSRNKPPLAVPASARSPTVGDTIPRIMG